MTEMRDYSQHGEQKTILAWADGLTGSFVDLGANDGATFSNTAALADHGWGGLCVDAAPDAAADCATRYRDRPDIDVLLAAFDHEGNNGPAAVYWTPEHMYSSLLPGRRDDAPVVPILVPRVDLPWLTSRLAAMPRPLFVSIDLEGGSVDALEWTLLHAQPDCVCVEANVPGDRAAVAAMLDGWEMLARNNWNAIYAR